KTNQKRYRVNTSNPMPNQRTSFFRHRGRSVALTAVVALCLGGRFVPSPAFAQSSAAAEEKSAERAAYEDAYLFEQLSGAARTRAELKFGTKSGPIDFLGPVIKTPAGPAPRTVMANNLVNDPSTDGTAQDTQSETTLTLGAGSNVVCAFNDSALSASFHFTGFSVSVNAGATWTDKGALPASGDGDAGDPVLAYIAKTGTILLATLSFNVAQNLEIFRSVDNGQTFTGPVNGAPGFT